MQALTWLLSVEGEDGYKGAAEADGEQVPGSVASSFGDDLPQAVGYGCPIFRDGHVAL